MYESERTEIQQMKNTKWIPRRMGSLLVFGCKKMWIFICFKQSKQPFF